MNRGGLIVRWIIGCGIFLFIMGLFSGQPGNAIILGPFGGLLFGSPLGLLHAFLARDVSKSTIHTYYACRSCGHEFRNTGVSSIDAC